MNGKSTKEQCIELIGKLRSEQILTKEEYLYLIQNRNECAEELKAQAGEVRDEVYGKRIFIRGLIEFTNYCRNDCIYCGIRRGNHLAERFRLSEEEIISCADAGYELGFRTFVLQGGEDPFFTDERMCAIIRALKERHPDCAVTLSLGEEAASGGVELGQPDSLPQSAAGAGVSDRRRIYGFAAVPDGGDACGGTSFPERTEPGYVRNRSVYTA